MKNFKTLVNKGNFKKAVEELSRSNSELAEEISAKLENIERQFNMGILPREEYVRFQGEILYELSELIPQVSVKQPFIFVHFSDVFKEVPKEEATGVAIIVDEGGIDTKNQYIANWKITNWDEL